jgi:hypothetical protein
MEIARRNCNLQYHLLLAAADLQRSLRISQKLRLPLEASRATLALRKAPLILEQHVAKGSLDLIRSEKATRTGVLAQAKAHVVNRRRCQLCFGFAALVAAHAEVAPGVEGVGVVVDFGVAVIGEDGDHDACTFGEDGAVG